jgi:hypothetical protein
MYLRKVLLTRFIKQLYGLLKQSIAALITSKPGADREKGWGKKAVD